MLACPYRGQSVVVQVACLPSLLGLRPSPLARASPAESPVQMGGAAVQKLRPSPPLIQLFQLFTRWQAGPCPSPQEWQPSHYLS